MGRDRVRYADAVIGSFAPWAGKWRLLERSGSKLRGSGHPGCGVVHNVGRRLSLGLTMNSRRTRIDISSTTIRKMSRCLAKLDLRTGLRSSTGAREVHKARQSGMSECRDSAGHRRSDVHRKRTSNLRQRVLDTRHHADRTHMYWKTRAEALIHERVSQVERNRFESACRG